MTLTGELKTQVENTNTKEEVKEVLEKEGIELTDEELDQVVGGMKIVTEKTPKIFAPLLRLIQKIIGK
jgi:bacteriocin-like protein